MALPSSSYVVCPEPAAPWVEAAKMREKSSRPIACPNPECPAREKAAKSA